MQDNDLTGRFKITNVQGASGTVAMQRLLNEEGADDLMMLMGLGVVGAVYTNKSEAKPLKMTRSPGWSRSRRASSCPPTPPPSRRSTTSSPRGRRTRPVSPSAAAPATAAPDHLFPMQLADTIGVDPKKVNYISYDGGGPLTTALLGAKIDVGMSGLGEFEDQIKDGKLRVLAVSGEERLDTVDAPTLTESGVDLVFTNWRGVLAPPGISDEQREYLTGLLKKMHTTDEWKEALAANGWTDNFATGQEFEDFLAEQDARVADTLKELGLA